MLHEQDLRHDNTSTDELIQTALGGDSQERAENAMWILRYRGTREVFDRAKGLCLDNSAERRFLGVCILSQLGIPDRSFPAESTEILLNLLQDETDKNVLQAIGDGLGHLSTEAGIKGLVKLSKNSEAAIRRAAARGLCGKENSTAITAVINLCRDADVQVRRWAAFGLGTQLNVDDPIVREVLHGCMMDVDDEVRGEALVGLARRKDNRILPTLSRLLESNCVERFSVEAAKELGDSALLPALISLKSWWNVDADLLNEAVVSCSSK
jgi:HEAT repeat protein